MPAKVRVFVSSTMEDLANERQAVVEQVRGLGLEPVNAEGLLPNGATSWKLLADEIQSSHIFILILGNRYGWIPTDGYGKHQNMAVTHLETDLARQLEIPILPFFKKLAYGTDATSDDAIRRDQFRREIADWAKGVFRADFDWAKDLGHKVRQALLDVFHDTYLKRSVRNVAAARPPLTVQPIPYRHHLCSAPSSPTDALLFAGAGFSIAAGYPTANTLAEVLGRRLAFQSRGSEILSRHSFADVAMLVEATIGRTGLVDVIRELLDTPIPVEPTLAHLIAVRVFPIIVTTNYDLLFEQACETLNLDYVVHTPTSFEPSKRSSVTIYKIDGSIADPGTLVLTNADYVRVQSAGAFWAPVENALQTHRVVVVGHSMRDATSRWVMAGRNQNLPGVYVSPALDEVDSILLHQYGLEGVRSDANSYMLTTFGEHPEPTGSL